MYIYYIRKCNRIFFIYQVKERRHLIFATQTQLDLLKKCKYIYADGIFRVIRDPFKQLWTIRGFLKSDRNIKQVLLVSVLMSGSS